MRNLNRHFKELLQLLNSEGVKYLVLGGYAVNYHGHHRNTKALDVWIATDGENASRVSSALQKFGFAATAVPADGFTETGRIFMFGRPTNRVDILTDPSGVAFGDCYQRRIETVFAGVTIPFISLRDLRQNKQASGRLQDLADLEELPDDSAASS